jgi:release factor glutamine methyltransferase
VIPTLTVSTRLGALGQATATLAAHGIETARQDAEWLLAAVLGVERFGVYLERGRELSASDAGRYRMLVDRRAAREPLQYLLGFEEFAGCRLAVTSDVLVPRPETEGLAGWAEDVLRERPRALVADIGTGSGAIACALARRLTGIRVLAVDVSPAALAVAARNVRSLGLAARVTLLAGDLLEPLGGTSGRFDLVVANPPYVPTTVIASLPPEVSRFEPRLALDGGPDGMTVARRIIAGAPSTLRPGGWLMMEMDPEQAGALASLMAAEGFTGIRARHDLAGRERYIAGQWAPASAPGAKGA